MQLYPFQEIGVEKMVSTLRMFLADDMGLGKTVQAIVACERSGCKRVLVVCQNSMKGIITDGRALGGWAEEIHKWASPGKSLGIVEGPKNLRLALIDKKPNYLIINYESIIVPEIRAKLRRQKWDAIIFDEHHKIKNRKAKVTKAARELCMHTTRVYMLSGTPILNRAQDIWAPLRMMFPKDKRFTSYWRFCDEYAYVERGVFGYVVRDAVDSNDPKTDALRQTLTPVFLRRTKPEVLKDMPSKTIQQVWVELDIVQRDLYEAMKKDFIIEYQDKVVSAAAVIAQIIRLKQIAVGPELMRDDFEGISGSKIIALYDILGGINGRKLVVFSQFRRALERIYEAISPHWNTELFTGAISVPDRTAAVDRFQHGQTQILLVTTQAGGQGLTLTAASTAVFLDKMWTPAMNFQAQDRLHRIGQKEPVTIIELLAAHTVEEGIENMLKRKQKISDNIIESEEGLLARDDMIKTFSATGRQLMELL